MQNFIGSFSPSNSFHFVNEQLYWEEVSPHRHDCHDPPHATRVGFHDAKSPPRRLAAVARSGPWKATPATVGFPGDATRRRRLPWVVGSDCWNNGGGKDCQWRYLRGEDRHPEMEFCPIAGLWATRNALEVSRLLPTSGGFGQLPQHRENQVLVLLVQLPEGLNEPTLSGARYSPTLYGDNFRFLIPFKE